MKFNKIFEAFPPPKFLNIPFAGLSISDSAIHCIQFGKKDGRIYIEKYAEVELSPGTIVSGEMHDKEKVLNIWKTLKKDLGFEHVKISLPEEKVYIFTAKIPIVKPEEVDEDKLTILASDIARRLEKEAEYAGQIKVTVIRETRAQATTSAK